MKRFVCLALFVLLFGVVFTVRAERKKTAPSKAKIWPDVLFIDDFEQGLKNWKNEDAGHLELTQDAPQGKQALSWTAGDDGLGHIIFKNLDRNKIDFSQYDSLVLKIRVSGKNVWNINPVIQQYPAVYGFRGLYYTVDTLYPYNKWYTLSIDLTRWENAWPNTFSRDKQEFQFEIYQLAGAGQTRVEIDDLKLIKNPLGIQPSYFPETAIRKDGGQVWHYPIKMVNHGGRVLSVQLARDSEAPGKLGKLALHLPTGAITLLPGEERIVTVEIELPATQAKEVKPFVGGMARVAFHIAEIPGLILFTELSAGVAPKKWTHPSIICRPARMKALQKKYSNLKTRKDLNRFFLSAVKKGEKLLAFEPSYPPLAATGYTHAPTGESTSGQVKAKLVEIKVPNLPFRVYQDPETGVPYSGPLFDAGMQGYLAKHMANAANARTLGVAYLISGRREFAMAAARILRGYIPIYLKLPITCIPPGSPVSSATSGSVRIGGTFMRERVWLGNFAMAMDSILPSGVLSRDDIRDIREKILVPSAVNMMNHKVGVMNLQFMIQSAALYAGLAGEAATLVARAVEDSHGIRALTRIGFLPDGNWWENPSYQNVAKLAAFPALAVCVQNGILPYTPALDRAILASYRMYGPDGRSPTLGTGGFANNTMANLGAFLFGNRSNNPEVNWLLQNKKPFPGFYGVGDMAMFRQQPSRMPKEKTLSPVPTKTINLPDYGGVAMRIPGTDRYCYMQYGRELVHGHRNKLSFQAYGKGGWYARNVMGGYGHNFADFLETIASANTIMVDGKNADMDTGTLLYLKSTDQFVAAAARENGAWKTVEHERAVVLTKGPLIVIDRVKAAQSHRYDWLYHPSQCGLALNTTKMAEPKLKSLGDSRLYSSLHLIGELPAGRASYLRTNRKGKKTGGGLHLATVPGGTLMVIHIKDTYRPHDSLLWRKNGKTLSFVAALWPYAKDETGKVEIRPLPVRLNGKTVGLEDGQGYEITAPEGKWIVLVNDCGKNLSCADLTSRERVGVKAMGEKK